MSAYQTPRDPARIAEAHEAQKVRRQMRLAYRYEDHAQSMARKVARSRRAHETADERSVRFARQMLSGRGQ